MRSHFHFLYLSTRCLSQRVNQKNRTHIKAREVLFVRCWYSQGFQCLPVAQLVVSAKWAPISCLQISQIYRDICPVWTWGSCVPVHSTSWVIMAFMLSLVQPSMAHIAVIGKMPVSKTIVHTKKRHGQTFRSLCAQAENGQRQHMFLAVLQRIPISSHVTPISNLINTVRNASQCPSPSTQPFH